MNIENTSLLIVDDDQNDTVIPSIIVQSSDEGIEADETVCIDADLTNDTIEAVSPVHLSSQCSMNVLQLEKYVSNLSPISEISFNLSDVSIGTPIKTANNFKDFLQRGNISTPTTTRFLLANTNLISNNFNINSSGDNNTVSIVNNVNLAVTNRNVQQRLFNPQILNFSISDDEHNTTDDISFFDETAISIERNSLPIESNVRNINNNIAVLSDSDDLTNDCGITGILPYESSPQRFIVNQNTITILDKHRSIDEIDGSSVDSGYGTNPFKFTEPKLPKKQLILDTFTQNKQKQNETSPKSFGIFNSYNSGSLESMEDDYMSDLIEMDSLDDDDAQFPSNLNSLISGHIKTIKSTPEIKRSVRRCLSLTESNTPVSRNSLFDQKSKQEQQPQRSCFKRPEPPSFSPVQSKRYKSDLFDGKENKDINENQQTSKSRPVFRKSISCNDADIMSALARSSSEPGLIGDFSKPFCLPVMPGRHQDLKSVSCDTVAKLLRGDFRDSVASYKIIDCRYPYEYEGGHIRGAENVYTHQQILEELVNCKTESPTVQPDGPKRHILIFHCEFSSERGPKLSRFLRSHDRLSNSHKYPALHYPEIYLLHNGYKEFYEHFSELCEPISYRPMLEPSFGDLYRQFRAKSKSWNGDLKKSRSRLVL